MEMKIKNQGLPVQEHPERGLIKWTSPKIVTIISEKVESGFPPAVEGGHTVGSDPGGS